MYAVLLIDPVNLISAWACQDMAHAIRCGEGYGQRGLWADSCSAQLVADEFSLFDWRASVLRVE